MRRANCARRLRALGAGRSVGAHLPRIRPLAARLLLAAGCGRQRAQAARQQGSADRPRGRVAAAQARHRDAARYRGRDRVAQGLAAEPRPVRRGQAARCRRRSRSRRSSTCSAPTRPSRTSASQIDFEDVLLVTAGMIESEPRVAQQVREQYRFFVVDEYQDVSPLQQELLGALAGRAQRRLRGRRRQPDDLHVRGRDARLPARLPERARGCDGRAARAELPLDAGDRGCRQPHHAAAGAGALDLHAVAGRAAGPAPSVSRVPERSRRGARRSRTPIRAEIDAGARARVDRHPVPHQRAVGGDRGRRSRDARRARP